jgi:hypothetical protein
VRSTSLDQIELLVLILILSRTSKIFFITPQSNLKLEKRRLERSKNVFGILKRKVLASVQEFSEILHDGVFQDSEKFLIQKKTEVKIKIKTEAVSFDVSQSSTLGKCLAKCARFLPCHSFNLRGLVSRKEWYH